jgi:hypothetical protein
MEPFFDPKTQQPVARLELAEGETKILGLKKYQGNEVAVRTGDYKIAYCDRVIQLKDKTKKSYNDHYDLDEVAASTTPVEVKGAIFFQVGGNGKGATQLTARYTNVPGAVSYAQPVDIEVAENRKRLVLLPARQFDTLWANHPLNPRNRALYNDDPSHPCGKSKWLVGQCMVRFCTALDVSGINLDGLRGKKCGLGGRPHKYHFIDPNDFEKWKGLKDGYAWEARPPYQAEPMPGIAAFYFTLSRRGVILFENYFSTDPKKGNMAGGHIDLWNRDRMGNTYAYTHPSQGMSSFARSRKVVFWPLE